MKKRDAKYYRKYKSKIDLERKMRLLMLKSMLGGRCVRCGYSKSMAALDFHHLDSSTKRFTLSTSLTRAWSELEQEANKCVLLCANCHRELHTSAE